MTTASEVAAPDKPPPDVLTGWVSRQVVGLGRAYLDDQSLAVATLARLRQPPRDDDGPVPVAVWPSLAGLPGELLGSGDLPTPSEFAAATALQLFATHQQGRRDGLSHQAGVGLGQACRELALGLGDDGALAPGVVRRFQSLGTTREPAELVWHLRHLVRMLRSERVAVDYGRLASDIRTWQHPSTRQRVLLSWSRGFYTAGRRPHDQPKDEEPDPSGAPA